MNNNQQYVVGFLFDESLQRVALIRKNKPEWQKGKLNGIGGKVEYREPIADAMAREFKEETGMSTGGSWSYYAEMDLPDWNVQVFAATGYLDRLKCGDESPEEEKIEIHSVLDVCNGSLAIVENLPWLIRLAIDHLTDGRPDFVEIKYPA